MRVVRTAAVPEGRAAEMIPLLFSKGIADPTARISKRGGMHYVPVSEGREGDASALGLEIGSGPAYAEASRPPLEKAKGLLEGFSDEELGLLPDRWEIAGSAVTLKLPRQLIGRGGEIGRAYAEALGKRTVLADVSGISGELRRPGMRVLYGSPGETVKTENGIQYCFDATKVMFASGNINERKRMGALECENKTVVDMFAGIGYFTLPLAKFAEPRRVFACEKNPDSYAFLVRNISLNNVGDRVVPILADNRSLCGKAFADRILMGYVRRTSEFIPKALGMAKPGCILHYHDTFPAGRQDEFLARAFDEKCGGRRYEILNVIEVKSFAPGVSHYVADVRV